MDYKECKQYRARAEATGLYDFCMFRDAMCIGMGCPILELTGRVQKDSLTIIQLMQDLHVMNKKILGMSVLQDRMEVLSHMSKEIEKRMQQLAQDAHKYSKGGE